MTSNKFQKGDLVWWTMGGDKPLKFENGEPFLGIVVRVAKVRDGVEVLWFNNDTFKVMNCDTLMYAQETYEKSKDSFDNRAKP